MPNQADRTTFYQSHDCSEVLASDDAEFLSFFFKSSNGFDFVTAKECAEELSIFSVTCCERMRTWHLFHEFVQMMQKKSDMSTLRIRWPDSLDPS
jgi:hypothetical protein